jgi:hypothetical protein
MTGTELVAFATLERDENQLAQCPPCIVLRFSSEVDFTKALLATKTAEVLKFVVVDTVVFAYEPVLKALQNKTQIPMREELLQFDIIESWPTSEIQPESIAKLIRENSQRELRHIIGTDKSIKLDSSQEAALLSGLIRRVCMIQGPPGAFLFHYTLLDLSATDSLRNGKVVHRCVAREDFA